jgi:hypothetical protein
MLRLALNGSLQNPPQHLTPLSDTEKKAAYDTLSSSPTLGLKTGFPMVFLSETGLSMFSPDRRHSHLAVDHSDQILDADTYFYQK